MDNREITRRRKEKAFLHSLSEIIGLELNNADVEFCTVTKVKLSGDGSHLKVYLAFDRYENKGLEGIQRSSGFIRSRLASTINQRIVPQLKFVIDDTYKEALKIENILSKLNKK